MSAEVFLALSSRLRFLPFPLGDETVDEIRCHVPFPSLFTLLAASLGTSSYFSTFTELEGREDACMMGMEVWMSSALSNVLDLHEGKGDT